VTSPPVFGRRWLLLLHQLPPKPDYLRVKIWRRLQRIGAVAIKNSVYVLPRTDQTAEHFHWILREIEASGGEFDIVVVDGEHRNQCARAAVARVKPSGAIVFDNSDRLSFADGVRYLSDAGWLRIDFFGLIPCYAYKNCTSFFFRDTRWLTGAPVPAEQRSSVGLSCSQAISD